MVSRGAFSQVVVPLDGNVHAERAVPVAVALARQAGATIRFVMVVAGADRVGAAEDYLVKLAGASGIHPVATQVIVGPSPGAVLNRFLSTQVATLVVLSSHARRNLAELLLGGVAVEVLDGSPHPVVLVGPRTQVPAAGYRYRELVVCLDDADTAPDLVNLCGHFAGELGLRPYLYWVSAGGVSADGAESALVSDLCARLEGAGLPAGWELAHGDAANSIVVFAADRPASLLALAASGPNDDLGHRSVTVAVARQSAIPVLVQGPGYHPEGVPLPGS